MKRPWLTVLQAAEIMHARTREHKAFLRLLYEVRAMYENDRREP